MRLTLRNAFGALVVLLACVVMVLLLTTKEKTVTHENGSSMTQAGIRYTVESPVYLYFQSADREFLSVEERVVAHPETDVDFAKTIVNWLISGSTQGLERTIPPETVLRALYVHDGTAYVDFSQEIHDAHPGGVRTEYLTIVSLANSLVLNIPDIKRVKILIEGREENSLAGHIDIRQPFSADMLVVR